MCADWEETSGDYGDPGGDCGDAEKIVAAAWDEGERDEGERDSGMRDRLERAEAEVDRLKARLSERELEVGRLLGRLEVAQAQILSKDAKVTELTRRLLVGVGREKAGGAEGEGAVRMGEME